MNIPAYYSISPNTVTGLLFSYLHFGNSIIQRHFRYLHDVTIV